MANEANDKNRFTADLKKKIQESLRNSFDRNVGGEGKMENPKIRKLEEDIVEKVEEYKKSANDTADRYKKKGYQTYNKELKKDEERNRDDYSREINDVPSLSNRPDAHSNSPAAFRKGLAADRARIEGFAAREAEAQRIKKKAVKEAEKKINKDLSEHPKMKGLKSKIAAEVISRVMGEAAYVISQKMAERANAGGAGAIIVVLITIFLALLTDVIDILGEIGITALIVSVIGTVPGAILGVALWVFNFFCGLIIIYFWVFVLGGGHKKWLWKRVARTVFAILIAESIPYLDLIPFATLICLWNTYDFFKDKKKARNDLEAFENEFTKTRKINSKYVDDYM